ncbi:MAG: glycine betaine ABC transporter substrate-binding protein [Actinomycetes bacterium]
MRRTRTTRLAAVIAAAGLSLSACGLSTGSDTTGDVEAGSIDSSALEDTELTVGSKDFTEQLVLGKITVIALKAAGADVTDRTNIQGSVNTRKSLTSGEIDLYWEYTGTGWITYLGETQPIPDDEKQYEATANADLKKNGIKWLDPAPFNNTYALALAEEKAQELGVETLSDYAALAKKDPDQASLCLESEFASRDDGFPGVEKTYGFQLPNSNKKNVDTGVVYTETDKGKTCTFGEVFTTDGRIQSLGLKTLEDDKGFFPIYEPSVTLKKETLAENPKIADVMNPIAAKLDTDTMRELNAQVDVKGKTPDDVAEAWMKKEGFIK